MKRLLIAIGVLVLMAAVVFLAIAAMQLAVIIDGAFIIMEIITTPPKG